MARKERSEKVKLSLAIPVEINTPLEEIASEHGSTKSDVLRRSLTLIDASHEVQKQNKNVGIFRKTLGLKKNSLASNRRYS